MFRCRTCLIPDTRPDTAFHDGQCSGCLNFAARSQVDWAGRRRRFEALLDAGRNGSGYDCIVPSSGGKDSHYQVLTLIEMGLRPLVVTAATCMLTATGRRNIDNLARYATTIEVTPNRAVRAKLNRFGLLTVGDISYPEHLAIFSVPFRIAVQLGIPTIVYGESPQREYGCPEGAEEAVTMTRRWVSEFGGLNGMRARDCVGYDGITARDMADYMLPDDEAMKGVTAYFMGQFIPWDSRRNAEVARKAGMEAVMPSLSNWWPFENLDNAQTGIHDWFCYLKYGYGRASAQLSVDIRNGLSNREEAEKIAADKDSRFPVYYCGIHYEEVLSHIGVSRPDFLDACNRFLNRKLFDREVTTSHLFGMHQLHLRNEYRAAA